MKWMLIILMLTGCATGKEMVRVEVPVSAACLGPDPVEPIIGAAKTSQEKAAAVQDYIAQLRAYIVELKAQMAGCKSV